VSRDLGHAPFSKKILRGHVGTVPGGMPAKFEVRSCTYFEDISIQRPKI